MAFWNLKSCSRCSGDLFLEADLWRCFQCARYYYANLLQPVAHPPESNGTPPEGHLRVWEENRYGGKAGGNIHSFFVATRIGQEMWWDRNWQIVVTWVKDEQFGRLRR